jgi:hypothetical protein
MQTKYSADAHERQMVYLFRDDYKDWAWEDIARWCCHHPDKLNDWETQFVRGMVEWIVEDERDPTPKQMRRLEEIFFVKLRGV